MAKLMQNVVTKIVEANEVESLTYSGWRLVEVLQETHVESFSESVPMVTTPGNYPQNFNATKGFLVTRNKYLMQQDGNTTVASLTARVQAVEGSLYTAQAHQRDAEAETEKQKKEVTVLQGSIERFTRTHERDAIDAQDLRKRNQKMENDIAKIRTAVGELKMKEILES